MDLVEGHKMYISSFSLSTHLDPHVLIHKVNFFMKGTGLQIDSEWSLCLLKFYLVAQVYLVWP